MTEPSTPASLDYALADRRVGRTTQVQLCDLTCPERLALMSAAYWCDWKNAVGQGIFKPQREGDQITIAIHDRAVCGSVQHVFTSVLAYEVFQGVAKDGRFDGLSPVTAGHKYGPWIWAGGVMDEAQVKALNDVV